MSDYVPTDWTDETPAASPVRYKITEQGGAIIANNALIEVVTAITPGTPLNAANLNHIEQGIAEAHDLAAALFAYSLYTSPKYNANWHGDFSPDKPVGTYVYAITDFITGIPATAKAIIATVSARWAVSYNDRSLNIRPRGSSGNCLIVHALSSNYFHDMSGIVPLNNGELEIVISGVNGGGYGPNSIYIDIWGFIP